MSTDVEPIVDTAELRERIRDMYREVAERPGGDFHFELGRPVAERLGYPAAWLDAIPAEALASFAGVGHMLDLARIQPGERVLDLGSGSGTDSFIAAYLAGASGRVMGVDMTDAQLSEARQLRDRPAVAQLVFVKGLIEQPPAEPESIDVIISNGVINLAPDKDEVFRAAAAALRPGGRIALADIVSERELIDAYPPQRVAVGGVHRGRRAAARLHHRDRGGRTARSSTCARTRTSSSPRARRRRPTSTA